MLMSHESDLGGPVYVSDGDVSVEKSFVADDFPVPAIKFRITSDSEEAVHVRIVDSIPKEFPMEGVGFHPDYESDNWTAYKDQRVEYERTLDPGESVTTVYGIRLSTVSEAEDFLVEPVLERPPVPEESEDGEQTDDGVEDILGEDRSQLVRDALQGNGSLADEESLPDDDAEGDESSPADADGDDAADADADDDAPGSAIEEAEDTVEDALESIPNPEQEAARPRELDDDSTPAIVDVPAEADDADEFGDAGEADDEASAEGSPTDGQAAADDADADDSDREETEYVDVEDAVSDADAAEADAEESGASHAAPAGDGSLASALAAEIRDGRVSDDDLELIRSELDSGLPRSADVRIRRLQGQMNDLEAYSDALAEFIDEEGTGADVVASLREEMQTVSEELDALEASVSDAEDERSAVRSDVSRLRGDLGALDERVENAAQELSDVNETADSNASAVADLRSDYDDVSGRVDGVESDVSDVSTRVADAAAEASAANETATELDGELGDVREDIAELDGDIVDAREELSEDIEAIRSDVEELSTAIDRIEELESTVEGLESFRHRLNDVFGAGAAAGDDDEE